MPDQAPRRGGARRAERSTRFRVRRQARATEPPDASAASESPAVVLHDAPSVAAAAVPVPASPTSPTSPTSPSAPARRGGARRRRRGRRTTSLAGTLGVTTLGAFVPGSGYLYAGRRFLGAVVLLGWLAVVGGVAWWFARDLQGQVVDLAFDPVLLQAVTLGLVLVMFVWAFVVLTSHRLVRQRPRPRWHTVVGNVTVGVLVLVGAAPVLLAARYAMVTADTVDSVFDEEATTATAPEHVTDEDPWAGQSRVNVLLLGGDGGQGRTGVRTDTVILVSMDTTTGRTVMFSLPRNMMNAQFPEDSPLHDAYPDGYSTGYGDPGYDMLNAVYGQVPQQHPGILGTSSNEGADAIKQAVSGSLGVPVDYYVLVNLEGFKTVVDAIGGITVNINEPVAINGNTDAGIPPTDWLDPGPAQHLDGFHALWYARGRYGSDDYARMDRQRCAIDAVIDAADPQTLMTRYVQLAQAGKEVVQTDVPRTLGPAFVDLLLKVKESKVRSVVFRSSDKFFSGDPDFDYMQEVVRKAIDPDPKPKGKKRRNLAETEDPVDVCAYTADDDTTVSAAAD